MGTANKKPTTKENMKEVMTSLGSVCGYSHVVERARGAPAVAIGVGFSQEVTFKLRAD